MREYVFSRTCEMSVWFAILAIGSRNVLNAKIYTWLQCTCKTPYFSSIIVQYKIEYIQKSLLSVYYNRSGLFL